MSVLRRLPLLALPFVITACNASEENVEQVKTAVEAAPTQAYDIKALTQRFEKIGVKVTDVVPSDIDGLVEFKPIAVLFSRLHRVITLSQVRFTHWMRTANSATY